METRRGKMEGKKGDDGKPVRNTSMRPRREITGRYIGFEKGRCATAIRMDGNAVLELVPEVGPEWSRKLFTKFPDSVGCSVKMQTPRLIPRLIGVCDYCRGELCRRVWRTLFSREQQESPNADEFAIRRSRFPSRLYFLLFFPRLGAHIYALSCAFFSFPDENVMSEVEIAGRGPLDALKVRMEFALCCVTKL